MLETYSWLNSNEKKLGVLGFFVSLILISLIITSSSIPEKKDLTPLSGSIHLIDKTYDKNGLKRIVFTVSTDSKVFSYTKKQGGLEAFLPLLTSELPVQILYDANGNGIFEVYEMKINTHVICSYEQYFTAQKIDDAWGVVGAVVFLALSIRLYFKKLNKARRYD